MDFKSVDIAPIEEMKKGRKPPNPTPATGDLGGWGTRWWGDVTEERRLFLL